MKSARAPSQPSTGFEDPLQVAWVLVGLLGILGGMFGVGFSILGFIVLFQEAGIGAAVLLFGVWCTSCSIGVAFGRAWALVGWVIALLALSVVYALANQPLLALFNALSTVSLLHQRNCFRGLAELRMRRRAAQPARA